MKTKEIEVWVDAGEFGEYETKDCTFVLEHERLYNVAYLKAKITVEIPEKKIEITEEQLYKIFRCTNTLQYDAMKQDIGF